MFLVSYSESSRCKLIDQNACDDTVGKAGVHQDRFLSKLFESFDYEFHESFSPLFIIIIIPYNQVIVNGFFKNNEKTDAFYK